MRISTQVHTNAAAGEVESVESSLLDFGDAGSIVSAVSRAYFSPAKTVLTALLLGPDFVDRTPFVSNFVRAFSPRRPAMVANPIPLPELSLETVKGPEETFVRCAGKIKSGTSDTLQAAVRALIPGSNRIVLDLTDVSYLDSSGLGALVGLYVSAKRTEAGQSEPEVEATVSP
jgi:anti-anti-sigma factor